MKIVLLTQAKADLDAIKDPLYSQILKRLQSLRRYPEIGPILAGPLAGYRATVVGHFRVVYKPSAKLVEICYIRDCRRS